MSYQEQVLQIGQVDASRGLQPVRSELQSVEPGQHRRAQVSHVLYGVVYTQQKIFQSLLIMGCDQSSALYVAADEAGELLEELSNLRFKFSCSRSGWLNPFVDVILF